MSKLNPNIGFCSICGERFSLYYKGHLETCYKIVEAKGLTGNVVCDGCNQSIFILDYPLHRTIEISTVSDRRIGKRICRQCGCYFSNSTLINRHRNVYHPDSKTNCKKPPIRNKLNIDFTCSICHTGAGNYYNDHLEKCYTEVTSSARTDTVNCESCHQSLKVTDYPIHRLYELTNDKKFRGKSVCQRCGCKFHNWTATIKHNNVFHPKEVSSTKSTTQQIQRPIREPLGNALQDGQTTTKKKTFKRKRQPEELTQKWIEEKSQQSSSQSKRSLTSPSFSSFPSNSSTPSSVEPLQSTASAEPTLQNELSTAVSPSGLPPSQSSITTSHLNKETPFCGFCGLKMPLQQWDHVARCHVKHVTKGIETCSEMVSCTICKGKVNYQQYALHFHQEFCKVRNQECPLKCDMCECTFKEKLTLRLHSILHRSV